jgi:hypothetical protein
MKQCIMTRTSTTLVGEEEFRTKETVQRAE